MGHILWILFGPGTYGAGGNMVAWKHTRRWPGCITSRRWRSRRRITTR